jgi:hypothetical protein
MRRGHCRITHTVVTVALCELVVSHLALSDYKRRLPACLLARLLLLASALGRSLSFVAQRCRRSPSDETLRKAVLYNLPGPDILNARLLAALHALLPACLRRQPRPAALDFHQRPFYGDTTTPGVRGGKPEAGTRYFWTYATLCLLSRGRRYTVGLTPVRPGETQEEAVCRLLAQAQQAGVRLRYLLMDRAFHDAAVIACLQERRIAFVVPLTRRGDEANPASTARFFRRGQCSGWSSHEWSALVSRWPPQLVAKRYRNRFGIETSYRQLGEGLAATTSKDERFRLLLVGLALLLRQYWCLSIDQGGQEDLGRGAVLRLVELRTWLLIQLADDLGLRLEVWIDLPEAATFTAA